MTNNRLTDFSRAVLEDRYLLQEIQDDEGNIVQKAETIDGLFQRVSSTYADNQEHAQRLYEYMSNLWFMPATPILANGGTTRGLPISCFLNKVEDSMPMIDALFRENFNLSYHGGGIGTDWSLVRSIGMPIKNRGKTSGVIPFVKVQDSFSLAVSQGGIRRGTTAAYLHISHPEIEEFIDIRRPTGGDTNRRCLNVHHSVIIPDDFMQAVQNGNDWELIDPHTKQVTNKMPARDLWIKILSARIETGEPYIIFENNAQRNLSKVYELNNLKPTQSNLCSEIFLHTGLDYLQKQRTAVCCLSSLNLEYYDEWKNDPIFIEDIMRFLDNVLQDFIERAPDTMKNAKYSATRERSVGLGVMGFHSFLQSKMTPIEGVAAKSWNKQIFKHIREKCDIANEKLGNEKGVCPDAEHLGIKARFANMMAVAPTASISIIAGNSSPGIEPFAANCYTHKTLSGSFIVRNKYLKKLLEEKGFDNDKTWSLIAMNEGSVQHLDCLTPEEKAVFKTAIEINQMWLVDHAADRQIFIDQGQSLNIFLPSDIEKKKLHEIHFSAWKRGVKSLYYCRSQSLQRAEKVPEKMEEVKAEYTLPNQDECLACQ